jgi:hypothetical protein
VIKISSLIERGLKSKIMLLTKQFGTQVISKNNRVSNDYMIFIRIIRE